MISKWAIKGMTLGLADVLLPYGIVVNAIAPGAVATPMLNKGETDNLYNPNSVSGRYANPSEIASLATYMVSDYGNLIVGDTYYITGGSGLIDLHR
jgi:3-oxoacyl-[acyl-carrier protein] reductase